MFVARLKVARIKLTTFHERVCGSSMNPSGQLSLVPEVKEKVKH
jgi:hypothetical protein